ncbi:MAG: glutamine synthetase, partial [Muribaculaceae bacterium]|nr:glutamine synthetase [Muribaculaceae bacterium]
DRNRSVLVRVPLGWTGEKDMCSQANPLEAPATTNPEKQTAELRSADSSADVYQLIAAMVVAAREGFEMGNALERAEQLYVSVNIHSDENKAKLAALKGLPDSCEASALKLAEKRDVFEKYDVFSPEMISGIIKKLESFKDGSLRKDISGNRKAMLDLVKKYWHCG